MQLKTFLNFVEKPKGFAYDRFELERDAQHPQQSITVGAATLSFDTVHMAVDHDVL